MPKALNQESKFEMDEKQSLLFNALTDLSKKVSLNSISGMKPAAAHKAAGGKCKNEDNRRKLANEILTKPDVVLFINSMAAHLVNPAIMTRDEMLEELTTISRVSTPNLTENGIATITELKAGFDIKLKSMDQLAKLAGYEAPTKTDGTLKVIGTLAERLTGASKR